MRALESHANSNSPIRDDRRIDQTSLTLLVADNERISCTGRHERIAAKTTSDDRWQRRHSPLLYFPPRLTSDMVPIVANPRHTTRLQERPNSVEFFDKQA